MPRYKDTPPQSKTFYTHAASNYFRDAVFDTAKWIYPDNIDPKLFETFSEEEKKKVKTTLNPNQVSHLIENSQVVLKALKKDVFEYTYKYPTEEINAFCLKLNPDYRRLTVGEQMDKELLSKQIREKFTEYSAEKELMLAMCDSETPALLRPECAMIDIFCSEDNIRRSKEIAGKLSHGSIEDKRRVYSDFFEKLEKMDLNGLDVMDDKNLIENFDRFKPILSVGPEIVNLIGQATKYGLDFSDESKRPFLEKMGMIADISYMARMRIDMMAHPVYSQIRFEDLGNNFFMNNVTDAEGEDIDIADYFEERGLEANRSAEGAMLQFGRIKSIISESVGLFDTSLSPEKRMEEYRKHYWDTKREIGPVKSEVVLVDGELVPAEYNDFATDEELDGLENQDNSEIVDQVIEENSDKILFDEIIEGKSALREEFDKNLAMIREVIPGYEISEEQIEKYLTPRRMAIKAKLSDYGRDTQKAHDLFRGYEVPVSYRRIIYTYFNTEAGKKAAEENERLAELVSAPTKEGEELRKKMYLDTVNALQDIDASKLSYDTDIDEALEYAADNIALLERGIEWQKANREKTNSLGFKFSPEDEKNLSMIEDKGVILGGMGGNYRHLAQMKVFNTFPFNDITEEQASLLAVKLPNVLKKHGVSVRDIQDYNFAVSFALMKSIQKNYTEPEKKQYTADDIIDVKPNFEDTREKLFNIYTEMLETTSLKELSQDSDFSRMANALKNTVTELASVDGPIDASKAAAIKLTAFDLAKAVKDYTFSTPDQLDQKSMERFAQEHPGSRPGDFDQVRLTLAQEMKSLLDITLNDKILFPVQICRNNDNCGVEYDPKLYSDAEKITSLMDEYGLDYESVCEQAKVHGITPAEYINNIYQQDLQAKMPDVTQAEQIEIDRQKWSMTADQITKFDTLGDVERFINAKGEKSIESLVEAFRACNRISSENKGNTLKCFQAGELLNSVGEKISDYISTQLNDKSVFTKNDIVQARNTMKRHFAAAESLQTKTIKSKEAAEKTIKTVENKGRSL